MYYIIGLGNPGEEYKNSRHNAGRMAAQLLAIKNENKKIKIIDSSEFMNNSGRAIAKYIKTKKDATNLIVLHDDIDLPLGVVKISWNKGSGGHKGLESIMRAIKTKEFNRIRIGLSPTSPKGAIKKPKGEKKVLDFILGKFKPAEEKILKKSIKRACEAVEMIVEEGIGKAMSICNFI